LELRQDRARTQNAALIGYNLDKFGASAPPERAELPPTGSDVSSLCVLSFIVDAKVTLYQAQTCWLSKTPLTRLSGPPPMPVDGRIPLTGRSPGTMDLLRADR
jgi:hypothetical protein